MQTSPLNRLVYFCWAAGGNMCLTSVSLARRFAAGLHCPLTAALLRLTVYNSCIQTVLVITVRSMSSHLRKALPKEVKWFLDPSLCLVLNLFILALWKGLWIANSKVNTCTKYSLSCATTNFSRLWYHVQHAQHQKAQSYTTLNHYITQKREAMWQSGQGKWMSKLS